MDRPLVVFGVTGFALLISATSWQQSQDQARLVENRLLEAVAREGGARVDLDERLSDLEGVLLDLSGAAPEPSAQVGLTEASLADLERDRLARAERLEKLELLRERLEREDPEAKIEELAAEIDAERDALEELASEALELARVGAERASRLEAELELERSLRAQTEDPEVLWRALLGPVVQLSGHTSVGSGVLLESRPRPDGDGHRTLLLTAWHVVRDMQTEPGKTDAPIPVRIYLEDGGRRDEIARALCHDVLLDVCLAELETREPVPIGARLASPGRVATARAFEPIYAVGCPLGTDPVPSTGQISSASHRVDGTRYWMINAPTYIGNSGGGIFDGESFELLGVFSKIYNHGSSRPTIVPHMGLVMPLDSVYAWLEGQGWVSDGEGGLIED